MGCKTGFTDDNGKPVMNPGFNNFEQKISTRTNMLSPVIDILSRSNQLKAASDANVPQQVSPNAMPPVATGPVRMLPPTCEYNNGDYHVRWHYDEKADAIVFNLTARLPQNRFTGITFGKGPDMRDAIVVQNMDHQLVVADMHVTDRGQYVTDTKQDITAIHSNFHDDMVQVSFLRPVSAFDTEDRPLEDIALNKGCQFFNFIVDPGEILLTANIMILRGPLTQPIEQLVCHVSKCDPLLTVQTQTATTTMATVSPTIDHLQRKTPHGTTSDAVHASKQPAPFCKTDKDNAACNEYINTYMAEVYRKYPRIDKVTRKVSSHL
ncbi:unnamed protein product [Soboliphyme baturini]|uniref:DOMON domain-containing protein n=1 Tax=Soboliphyme baturini TaxID=241478 RepID=A0A183ISY7_9BILA|nr:unnamed protein product [Soboliphyme baturini]